MPELTKTFFEKILRDSERQELQVGDLIIFVEFSVSCSGWIFFIFFSLLLYLFRVDEYALLSGDQSESKGWERVWSALLLRGDDDEQRDYDENRLKIKSKVMVLIFGEGLNYKSGLGFLHKQWKCQFWPLFMAKSAKSVQVGTSKKGTSSAGTKNPRPLL